MTADGPVELPGVLGQPAGVPAEPADSPDQTPQNPAKADMSGVDSPEQLPAELLGEPAEAAGDPTTEPNLDQNGPGPGPGRAPVPRRVSTYDWPAMKRRYVEGVKNGDEGLVEWPSMDAVAEHFGVKAGWLREVAAREGWRGQRTQWQAQVETTRRQARAAALSKSAVELDGRALDASKVGMGLVMTRLQQIAREREVIPVDAQEQQRLAQALDLWHRIGLRAVGDPETHRLEITGANGAPIEIAAELRRDDPTRIAGVLGVLQQAGLGDLFGRQEDVLDGEVVP